MKNETGGFLFCSDCGGEIGLKKTLGKNKIFSCKCFEYPEVNGIIYLSKTGWSGKAVSLLKANKPFLALKSLLTVRLKLFIPLFLLIKSGLARLIGLRHFIRILTLFSFDKKWAEYIIARRDSDYLRLSQRTVSELYGDNLKILDIGCGVGQLFTDIYREMGYPSVIGLDKSFLDLLIAKTFFGRKDTVLICADIERDPVKFAGRFDLIHLNDTFQYIRNKPRFLSYVSGFIKKEGILALIHTHKHKMKGGIRGIPEERVNRELKKIGYKGVRSGDDSLFDLVNKFGIGFPVKRKYLIDAKAYSVLASKDRKGLKLMEKFRANKGEIVFVSPHLDDAILSAGGLISRLREYNYKVRVITVFTKGDKPPYTPQTLEYLKSCKYNNAVKFFSDRRKEDANAMKHLGVKYAHLGFSDAAFRKDSKGVFNYPSLKQLFSGFISDNDKDLVNQISLVLKKYIRPGTVIFAPLAVGGHSDHQIVREIIKHLPNESFYWEDYPYNLKEENAIDMDYSCYPEENIILFSDFNISSKQKLIRFYASQVGALFPGNDIRGLAETFIKSPKQL